MLLVIRSDTNRMELDNNLVQYEYQKHTLEDIVKLWINNHYVEGKKEEFLISNFRLCIQ